MRAYVHCRENHNLPSLIDPQSNIIYISQFNTSGNILFNGNVFVKDRLKKKSLYYFDGILLSG